MSKTVKVDLGARSYDIRIGSGVLSQLGEMCASLGMGTRCLLVTDSNVDRHYRENCVNSLADAKIETAHLVIPAGEESKSLKQLDAIYDAAIAAQLDRQSFIVALGGGVVGDLAGYAAASYLRGIRYVQVPTSVVALVDSAVGGKTGINLRHGKNLVGAFHQPSLVLADLETLRTLPEREYISGMAEVVKYGVIRDADLFSLLEKHAEELLQGPGDLMEKVVARCCLIKADVVREDEREGGVRAILNYGHTLGHALEKVAGYGELLHGEAISIGMVFAGHVSEKVLDFSDGERQRLSKLLEAIGLPVMAPNYEWAPLRDAIAKDKKTIQSMPKFVLARALGDVAFGCEVEESILTEAWSQIGG